MARANLNLTMLSCTMILAQMSTHAFAQAAGQDQSAPANNPAASPEKPAQNGDSSQLEEIVVTSQKRAENVQSVPIAITAITAGTARDAGILSTQDLTDIAPGLEFNSQATSSQVFLRGVGTDSTVEGAEDSVAIFVDGVYQPALSSLNFSFNNIERIEVLKGPQGTLYGRNATGGAINIITRDPTQDPHIDADIGYGSYNTLKGDFYGSMGITPKLAADLALTYSDQMDGWGRNLFDGHDANKSSELGLRSKWQFTADDDTKITLSFSYIDERRSAGISYRASPNTTLANGVHGFPGDWWDIDSDIDPELHNQQGGVSGRIEHDFGVLRLVSVTAYQQEVSSALFTNSGAPIPFEDANQTTFDQFFTQEVQLLSPAEDKLQWIVGAFYFHGHSGYDPLRITGLAVTPLDYLDIITSQATNSQAMFAQATYPIADSTDLTVGARGTIDRRRFSGLENSNFGVIAGPVQGSLSTIRPTWRIALDHHFDENVMGYISYNRGFKSGLFNTTNPANPPIGPETLDDYEVGAKSDLLNEKLRLNGDFFYYRYKGLQLSQYANTVASVPILENAARAEIYGVDLDGTAVITPVFSVRGGLEVLHTSYTQFKNAPLSSPAVPFGNSVMPGDASGNDLEQAPDVTFDVGAKYRVPTTVGEFAIDADYYFNDGFFWAPDNRVKQPSYNILNAQVSWTPVEGPYFVTLWGKNLTDARYFTQLTEQGIGDTAVSAPPLTFGVTLSVSM